MPSKRQGFTLVELIVVITILAILGTIAFVSLQGYSKEARDSKRLTDVRNLIGKITIENTKGSQLSSLITDTKPITLKINGTGAISNIGKANFVNLKELETNFKDPLNTNQDYPLAYSIGGMGSGAYSFAQAATINESRNEAVIVGSYYKMQDGDAPSLFKSGSLEITDGGTNLPYNPTEEITNNDDDGDDEGGEGGEVLACHPNPTPEYCFGRTQENGGITITAYDIDEEGCGPDVIIPCELDGLDVKKIDEEAISYWGSWNWGESEGITSVIIPSTVKEIGSRAFALNERLTHVTFLGDNINLGEDAFCSTSISSVTNYDGRTSDSFVYFPNGSKNLIVGFFGKTKALIYDLRYLVDNIEYTSNRENSSWYTKTDMVNRLRNNLSSIEELNSMIPTLITEINNLNSISEIQEYLAEISEGELYDIIYKFKTKQEVITFLQEYKDLDIRADIASLLEIMITETENMSTKTEVGAYIRSKDSIFDSFISRINGLIGIGDTIGGKSYEFEEGYLHFGDGCPM